MDAQAIVVLAHRAGDSPARVSVKHQCGHEGEREDGCSSRPAYTSFGEMDTSNGSLCVHMKRGGVVGIPLC